MVREMMTECEARLGVSPHLRSQQVNLQLHLIWPANYKPIMVSLLFSIYKYYKHPTSLFTSTFHFHFTTLRNQCSFPEIFSMFSENNQIFLPTFKLNQSIIESFCTFRKYSFIFPTLTFHPGRERVNFKIQNPDQATQTRQIQENKKKYKF